MYIITTRNVVARHTDIFKGKQELRRVFSRKCMYNRIITTRNMVANLKNMVVKA